MIRGQEPRIIIGSAKRLHSGDIQSIRGHSWWDPMSVIAIITALILFIQTVYIWSERDDAIETAKYTEKMEFCKIYINRSMQYASMSAEIRYRDAAFEEAKRRNLKLKDPLLVADRDALRLQEADDIARQIIEDAIARRGLFEIESNKVAVILARDLIIEDRRLGQPSMRRTSIHSRLYEDLIREALNYECR